MSHFLCKCKDLVTQAIFWLKIIAESDEQMSLDGQVSSVVSAAPDSLEAVASTSNTSFNHPDVTEYSEL